MNDKDAGRKDTAGCNFSRIYMYICQNHEITYKADESEKSEGLSAKSSSGQLQSGTIELKHCFN